ncbi:hypothetical protein ACLB2K_070270 [Fragaria x ananassa]
MDSIKVCENHPQGVILVRFKDRKYSQKCIELMNGRWFGGRLIHASEDDGLFNHAVLALPVRLHVGIGDGLWRRWRASSAAGWDVDVGYQRLWLGGILVAVVEQPLGLRQKVMIDQIQLDLSKSIVCVSGFRIRSGGWICDWIYLDLITNQSERGYGLEPVHISNGGDENPLGSRFSMAVMGLS